MDAATGRTDPFDTAAVRERVLDTWRGSPARFREDANTEEDLRLGGYRDRMFGELAANAADAALAAGEPGELAITVSGGVLRVANTGRALDASGVTALASLRASAKRDDSGVGRFGVGFAAVLAVSDEPEVVSTSGAVRFSAENTRAVVAEIPELARELRRREGAVPVLRLPWPCSGSVPAGFDTEVRLPLPAGADPDELLDDAAREARDLLLALPALRRITVGGREWSRHGDGEDVTLHGQDGEQRWRCLRRAGRLAPEQLAGLGVEARERREFSVCWALRLDADGMPLPEDDPVLHAPTRTDEQLSLGVRLFATVPTEADRRRVLPGAATDAVLLTAAEAYPDLLLSVPGSARAALVPAPELPRSGADATLRDAVLAALRTRAWLPAAGNRAVSTFAAYDRRKHSRPLTPAAAVVLDGATTELVELLADAVPGLLDAEFSAPRHVAGLNALGVSRMASAGLADALVGVDRPASWWQRLYTALRHAGADVAELGGLPVPLADGRTTPGARGVLLASDELRRRVPEMWLPGLRIVHAEAVDPLLERLGARWAGAVEVLDSAELAEAVARGVSDAAAGLDVTRLARLVVDLVRACGVDVGTRAWLGGLPLPDADGEYRRADELLLPDAALREVLRRDALGADGPVGVLDAATVVAYGRAELVAVGVLDGFAVVCDEEPVGPEHDLPDEDEWWAAIDGDAEPPWRVLAVRDLDLVAEDSWERALALLAGVPRTWEAMREPSGYTAWWIARYALLAGSPPRDWRLPSAGDLAGLYDPVPVAGLPRGVLSAAGVREALVVADDRDAGDLLVRLGDSARDVRDDVVLRAHAALANAVAAGIVDPEDVTPPELVRCVGGALVGGEEAVVADRPWLLGAFARDRMVVVGEDDGAGRPGSDGIVGEALAELLDVAKASDAFSDVAEPRGEPMAWADLAAVRASCALLGAAVPDGGLVAHERLVVSGVHVPWWVWETEASVTVHVEDTTAGIARALAWTLGRWRQRYLLAALLEEPDPVTLLG